MISNVKKKDLRSNFFKNISDAAEISHQEIPHHFIHNTRGFITKVNTGAMLRAVKTPSPSRKIYRR